MVSFFCLLKYTKNADRLSSILHEKDAKNNPPKRERLILGSANHNLFQTPFQFDILHLRLGLAYLADISECMALGFGITQKELHTKPLVSFSVD